MNVSLTSVVICYKMGEKCFKSFDVTNCFYILHREDVCNNFETLPENSAQLLTTQNHGVVRSDY